MPPQRRNKNHRGLPGKRMRVSSKANEIKPVAEPCVSDDDASDGSVGSFEGLDQLDSTFLTKLEEDKLAEPLSKQAEAAQRTKEKILGGGLDAPRLKKRKLASPWTVMDAHELEPRELDEKPVSKRLPIKEGTRLLPNQRWSDSDSADEDEKEQSANETAESSPIDASQPPDQTLAIDDEEDVGTQAKAVPLAEAVLAARHNVQAAKEEIARISLAILNDDSKSQVNKLKTLLSMADEGQSLPQIRKLALLSLAALYGDILPGYRLRKHTEAELKTKTSKDVKRLRQAEEALLGGYQAYLQLLFRLLNAYRHRRGGGQRQAEKEGGEVKVMADMATKCLCELLLARPDFNFAKDIVQAIVKATLFVSPESLDKICTSLSQLYKQDQKMEMSLEAVKATVSLAKSHSYNIPAKLVEIFPALPLSADLVDASLNPINNRRTEPAKHISRANKKQRKEDKKLEEELEQANAQQNRADLKRRQTEILKQLCLLYFRVLKSWSSSPLLEPVLLCLSEHAHLLNVDFLSDLLSVLRAILDANTLSLASSLHSIRTAFRIVSGPGAVLLLDTQALSAHLLRLTSQVALHPHHIPLLLQCYRVMLKQRQLTDVLAAAQTKALLSTALHVVGGEAIGLVAMANLLMQRHPKTRSLMSSESAGLASIGTMAANGLSPYLWELPALTSHPHPAVAVYAEHMLTRFGSEEEGTNGTLPPYMYRDPELLVKEYCSTQGGFNPPIKAPRRHPRAKALGKAESGSELVFALLKKEDSEWVALTEPVARDEAVRGALGLMMSQ